MQFLYIRLLLRTSILYLAIGTILGLFRAFAKVGLATAIVVPLTLHIHILTIGFLLQLIMGVALWMFPRLSGGKVIPQEKGGLTLYLLLNTGIILRSTSYFLSEELFKPFYSIGIILQVLSIFLFIYFIAFRIRKVSVSR